MAKAKQHIMGNFNTRIGQQEQGEVSVIKYGYRYRKRNECGYQLIEFAEAENLSIMNSFFKKKPQRKWTWKHPNERTSEIDYILAIRKSDIADYSVLNRFNTGNVHRIVRCKVRLNTELEREKLIRKQVSKIVDLMKL